MYSKTIKVLVSENFNKHSTKLKPLLPEIIKVTSFLPVESKIKERMFCIINDLTSVPKCKCGTKVKWNDYKKQYRDFCSYKCSNKHTASDPIVREKTKQTNLERYGGPAPVFCKDVREKTNQTNIERYGVEWTTQVDEIKEKKKQTFLKNYGVDNPNKCKQIREKTKQTNLERYGGVAPQCNITVQEKTKQTNLERYGTNTLSQRHNIQSFHLLNNYDWLYHNYIIQQKSTYQIADELNIDPSTVAAHLYKNNILARRIANFSYKAINWLEYISQNENIFIQHALNGGEYQIPNTKYCADGYCKETNTIYEFHGNMWHGNPEIYSPEEHCHPFDPNITAGELYQRTIERENTINSHGYKLTIMWENQWKYIKTK